MAHAADYPTAPFPCAMMPARYLPSGPGSGRMKELPMIRAASATVRPGGRAVPGRPLASPFRPCQPACSDVGLKVKGHTPRYRIACPMEAKNGGNLRFYALYGQLVLPKKLVCKARTPSPLPYTGPRCPHCRPSAPIPPLGQGE